MYKNPFIETLDVPFIRWIKRDVPAKLEIEQDDYYDIEAIPSTRLYRSKASYNLVSDLSVTGYKLFMWILFYVPDNAISMKLDEKELTEHFQCSCKTVQRARLELMAAALIAKCQDNRYWLNPKVFASNSRLSLFPEHKRLVAVKKEPKKTFNETSHPA